MLSWIAVVTSVAVLGTAGAGWVLVNRYDGNINRITGVLGDDAVAPTDDGPRNVLIVGSDSRDVEGEAFQGVGDEEVTGQRSDVIMLAHLYGGESRQMQLVSIPRDSWVPIPAYTDPATGETSPAHEAKINSAFFVGGPALLVSTVEQLSGLSIDHYMQVDFDGFRAIIDEVDGVEVCLSKPAKEVQSGIDLPAGRSVVMGDQALAFVRQRTGLAQGDIDRIQRQQRLIGALVRKTLSRNVLLNPLKLNGVLEIATNSLQVDEGLTFGQLRELALRFRSISADSVTFTTVPISDSAGRREGQSVVLLDEVAAAELFAQIARDVPPGAEAPPGEAEPPQEPLIVAPDRIRVQVRNGSGIEGTARQASDDLAALGFLVRTPDTADVQGPQTVVRHGPSRADSARTVAAALPGATVELDPALDGVVEVVVGSSYDGVAPVTVSLPEQAAPPSQAPVLTAEADPCGV